MNDPRIRKVGKNLLEMARVERCLVTVAMFAELLGLAPHDRSECEAEILPIQLIGQFRSNLFGVETEPQEGKGLEVGLQPLRPRQSPRYPLRYDVEGRLVRQVDSRMRIQHDPQQGRARSPGADDEDR